MTNSDFVGIRLPLPLLNALHRQITTTGQTETEVLLAALSAYLKVETQENCLDLDTVSVKRELTIVQQEIAVMQQRLAIVEQSLILLPTVRDSVGDKNIDAKERHALIEAIAVIKPTGLPVIEDDDTDDEPDEILYGFLDPEDR